MTRGSFFDLTRTQLTAFAGSHARAVRLYNGVYRERIDRFDRMSTLSAGDRSVALERFHLELPEIASRLTSADGTTKFLLRFGDGEQVESVLIPEAKRVTFCVSSQVGCALACKFCLTGLMGLTRNLSAGEIVAQVLLLSRELPPEASGRFSVVLMGMGEPLQNYESVVRAIEILNDDHGVALPLRRITVSTAGLVPGIERLARERRFPNLSISLTGTTGAVRDELMPINRKHPIRELIAAVRRLPEGRRRHVMFEYVAIKGITDSEEDARRLSSLLSGLGSKVNLIPLNPSPAIPFERADESAVHRFQSILIAGGIATFIRRNRGDDVSGACGQLALGAPRVAMPTARATCRD